jgi:hypothetical protein
MNSIDNNNKPKILCKNCNSYAKNKIFDDGFHTLVINGDSSFGAISGVTNFIVDTKKPIIRKTLPNSGFVNGEFSLEFQEANPKEIFLIYGNEKIGYRKANVNFNLCKEINYLKRCDIKVYIKDFNTQKISYYFGIIDMSDKRTYSNEKIVEVDLSPPLINSFNYTIIKRDVNFFFNISESNFYNIRCMDYNETVPTKRTLCSSLKGGICNKKVHFKEGEHNLVIEIKDKAENSQNINISIQI